MTTAVRTLLQDLQGCAAAHGWLCAVTPDDLVVLTDGVSVLTYAVLEDAAPPTKAQARWLVKLSNAEKVEYGILRPQTWPQVVDRLTRRSGS